MDTQGFVKWVKKTFIDPREDERDLRKLKRSVDGETILDVVATEGGCTGVGDC
jgi:hypothetical protein